MSEDTIKAQTIDLAKTLSYLLELSKTKNQSYVTKEGIALLEGVCLAGNGKVKVVPLETVEKIVNRKPKKKSFF